MTGPGERVEAQAVSLGLGTARFRRLRVAGGRGVSPGAPRDAQDGPNRWMLVPRSIPPDGIEAAADHGAAAGRPFPRNPASHQATLLFDQTFLTTGYPQLTVSGGEGREHRPGLCRIAMAAAASTTKGNRNEIEGKQFVGAHDTFIADGGHSGTSNRFGGAPGATCG